MKIRTNEVLYRRADKEKTELLYNIQLMIMHRTIHIISVSHQKRLKSDSVLWVQLTQAFTC